MSGIRVELELDDGSFTSRILHAGESLQQFQRNVGGTVVSMRQLHDSSRGVLQVFRDLSIVMGVAGMAFGKIQGLASGFLGDIVKVNAEMERLTFLMKSMSSATDPLEDAQKNVRYLRDAIKTMPFSLSAVTDTFVRMKATGLDPMNGGLQALADGVAGVGGTDESLKRVALGISQMAGKGVIQMEELRQQLGEQMPRAVELMARSMGVSMGTLIKEIATGTVAAKPALEQFMREVDRVYGGSAKGMMETLSGQMTLVKANLQELALVVGNSGFNDAFKKQLTDLNQFMSSGVAKNMGVMFGEALTSVVNAIRSALDFVVEFKNEILAVGQALLYGFGFQIAAAAVASFIRVMSSAASVVKLMFGQYVVASTAATAAANANTVANMTNAQSQLAQAGAMSTMGRYLPMIVTGMTGIVAAAPLLIGGLVLVSEYFGLFRNKTKDAWEELEKFGASSRKQAEAGVAFVDQLETKLKGLYKARENQDRMAMSGRMSAGLAEDVRFTKELIDATEKELDRIRPLRDKFLNQGTEADVQKGASSYSTEIERRFTGIQATYDREMRALEKFYDEQRQIAIKGGRAVDNIEAERAKSYQNRNVAFYQERLDLLEWYELQAQQMLENGNETQRRVADVMTVDIVKRIQLTKAALKDATENAPGIVKIDKAQDTEALIKKGQEYLKKMTAETQGLAASMMGLNPEIAELRANLAQMMKFGDPQIAAVKNLIDEIDAAKIAYEELSEIVNGQKKYDAAVAAERLKNERDIIDMQTKGLSGMAKIDRMRELGYFGPMGPQATEAQRRIQGVVDKLKEVNDRGKEVSATLAGETFGSKVETAAQRIATVFENMARSMGLAVEAVGKVPTLAAAPVGAPSIGGVVPAQPSTPGASMLQPMIEGVKAAILQGYQNVRVTSEVRNNNPFSMHGHGQAIDVSLKDMTQDQRREMIAKIVQDITSGKGPFANVRGIGTYNASADLLHLDTRPKNAAGQINGIDAWGPGNSRTGLGQTPPWFQDLIANLMRIGAGGAQTGTNLTGITTANDRTNPDRAREVEQQAEALRLQRSLGDEVDKYKAKLAEVGENLDGKNKHLAAANKFLDEQAKLAADQSQYTDRQSAKSQELLRLAKEMDEAEERKANRQKAVAAVDDLEKARRALEERKKLAQMQMEDPLDLKNTKEYVRYTQMLAEQLETIRVGFGQGSTEYANALKRQQVLLAGFRDNVVRERVAGFGRENMDLRISLMDTASAREAQLQLDIQRIRAGVAAFSGSEEERVRITAVAEERIRMLKEKTAQAGPIGAMLKEWSNLTENFQKSFVGTMNSAVDALADFIVTGKTSFKDMVTSWAKTLISMAIKKMLASIFNVFTAGMGGGGGGILSGLFGSAHTGGIIGGDNLATRSVSPTVFLGAPRFHTGGVIGRDEVPIIAKKDEGVFTPGQMKALGRAGEGSRGGPIQINAPITVNGSSGTPEQNNDLAKKMQRAMEGSMRGIVIDEIMKQRRPGNLLGK